VDVALCSNFHVHFRNMRTGRNCVALMKLVWRMEGGRHVRTDEFDVDVGPTVVLTSDNSVIFVHSFIHSYSFNNSCQNATEK